ncbi:MAG: fasciclin domain-containing protein [Nocardioides sp.]|nr:fasciclin domain-containing protein [Nocardioides sp.]
MKRSALRRSGGIAAIALSLSVTLAACSDDAADTTASDTTSESSAPAEAAPSEAESSEAAPEATGAGAETFGEGCAAVPTEGPGSFDGMVTDPVATAASNNPLLETLVTAVSEAGLVETLNGLPAATVFAPTNDAFAAIPEDQLTSILADKALLTKILTHHVLPEKFDPTAVVGEQPTVNGDNLTIEGDETGMTVTDSAVTANVICGNVPTANATVYVIDAVMAGAA